MNPKSDSLELSQWPAVWIPDFTTRRLHFVRLIHAVFGYSSRAYRVVKELQIFILQSNHSANTREYTRKLSTLTNTKGSLNSCSKSVMLNFRGSLQREDLLEAKQAGFSDKQLGRMIGVLENDVRNERIKQGVKPWVKQVHNLLNRFVNALNRF